MFHLQECSEPFHARLLIPHLAGSTLWTITAVVRHLLRQGGEVTLELRRLASQFRSVNEVLVAIHRASSRVSSRGR
jgi:hypothetical protein